MKFNKYFLALLLLFCADFYAMKRPHPAPAMVQAQVAFVPQDDIKNELFALLDNAKKQVLVAMYWITDNTIVDKLIATKQRGVDIQIIFDETSQDHMAVVNKLLSANIAPIIFPSVVSDTLMHNKFLVIDGATVFTGSANFTGKACNFKGRCFNHENIVILNSVDIAQKYASIFREIEEDAFELYVEIIANEKPEDLPEWATRLLSLVYQKEERLRKIVQSGWQKLEQDQQGRLQRFFKFQPTAPQIQRPPAPIELPTQPQQWFLKKQGISTEGMSKGQATVLIGKIKSGQPVEPTYSEQGLSKKPKARPISAYQEKILRGMGYKTQGMSYDEAYELIGEIYQEEA